MKKSIIIFLIMLLASGCESLLEEEVFSRFGASNFYKSETDAVALLNAAYSNTSDWSYMTREFLMPFEACTDTFWETGGGINTHMKPVIDFVWDEGNNYLGTLWKWLYKGIFYANVVIDQVPAIEMNEERKARIIAEARFLRAWYYYHLNDLWGPVPLLVTSKTSPQDRPARATSEEMLTFIENELMAAAGVLPVTQDEYPRATRGAALGYLTRFYLNQKRWTEAAQTAKDVMDEGVYDIFIGVHSRTELFDLNNEGNNEFIFVAPLSTSAMANSWASHVAPPNFQFKYPPHVNYAAQYRLLDGFVNTFDPADQRLEAIMFQYYNINGDLIILGKDDKRPWKYPEDPNGIGGGQSNDFPLLRYADILLMRAEALNELYGPTQEALDLIDKVRNAAGLPDLSLADFPDKTSLRDHILKERGWEFYCEAIRRTDLIRHGKFIENAIARGKPAQDYQVLFPIPLAELQTNENIVQNEGYE
jgi:hypothetical protein